VFLAVLFAQPATAQQRYLQSLLRVEPQTRLEQVCDIEAARQIRRDTGLRVDRAKADISRAPVHSGHTVTASGGAFRAAGQWRELSFTCTGTPDHLHVVSLKYKIGPVIPESKWAELGLWR